jgi:hypothetical protein
MEGPTKELRGAGTAEVIDRESEARGTTGTFARLRAGMGVIGMRTILRGAGHGFSLQ